MKKILFSLVALVCSMSMNAQIMKVMKNGVEVANYEGADYTFVFEKDPYTRVTFLKGDPMFGETDFTGFGDYSPTITASNDDVSVSLTLSGDGGPCWNEMGDIDSPNSKLTITVTPKKAGVTVSGIEFIGTERRGTRTGAGPWQFDVNRNIQVCDGSTVLGFFRGIVVKYIK